MLSLGHCSLVHAFQGIQILYSIASKVSLSCVYYTVSVCYTDTTHCRSHCKTVAHEESV